MGFGGVASSVVAIAKALNSLAKLPIDSMVTVTFDWLVTVAQALWVVLSGTKPKLIGLGDTVRATPTGSPKSESVTSFWVLTLLPVLVAKTTLANERVCSGSGA